MSMKQYSSCSVTTNPTRGRFMTSFDTVHVLGRLDDAFAPDKLPAIFGTFVHCPGGLVWLGRHCQSQITHCLYCLSSSGRLFQMSGSSLGRGGLAPFVCSPRATLPMLS